MLPTGACHGQARLRSAGKTLAAAFGCAKYRALQPSSARALVDRKPKLGTIPNVANAIRMAEDDDGMTLGRTVLFIGAGCSKSAGIPLATEIAKRLVVRLAKKMKAADKKIVNETVAYRWLASSHIMRDCCSGPPPQVIDENDNREIDWSRVYDALFDDHYVVPDQVRAIFSEFVETAGGMINWAHLCVGELVKQRLVSTVITTNFDQFVLAGLVRAGELPVVCDGIESLARITALARHPQLIELHGSRHTYRLRNSRAEVAEVGKDNPAVTAIGSIFQGLNTFVAVGYGGREDGVMDLLVDAGNRFPDKQLIWVEHGKDPNRISDKAKAFLATSRNALLLVDQDADSFFLQLFQALGIGAPTSISEPLHLAQLHAATIAQYNASDTMDRNAITAEISRCRNEIEAMGSALINYRKNQKEILSKAATALAAARELRLAGRFDEALEVLTAVPEESRDLDLWNAIGESALELGQKAGDQSLLKVAEQAFRTILNPNSGKT